MVRASLLLLLSSTLPAQNLHLYIGGYGKGIYTSTFNAGTGTLTPPALDVETPSPSFLAVTKNFLYAVNETNDGRVSSFAISRRDGKLTPINSASAKGAGPCHLSLDPSGRSLFVANYSSGSIAVLPVDREGRLGEATSSIQHSGTKPHAHWIALMPGKKTAAVADLGLDQILFYRFDSTTQMLAAADPPFVSLPKGSGPRHVAFHPSSPWFYVINELASTITTFSANRLSALETVTTLPADFTGTNSTAEIAVHPSGKFLYGSNRGHDSIAVFAIDQTTGALTLIEHVSTRGKTPRNFEIDPSGQWLLAANQKSDNIAVFRIDVATGRLKPAGLIEGVPAPACLKFGGPA